jgi:hypothetical protein
MLDKLFLMLKVFHNYYFPNNDIVREHFLLLIDEKNPSEIISLKESFLFKYCFLLTLQASHVTAPKWIPDADAPQTRHGNFLYKSSVFGPTDSRIIQMNKTRKNEEENVPWGFIPTEIHFWNRQYWHWVRERFVIEQEKSLWHLYFLFPSPVAIERRKNF